jgi:hypothetical protein
MLVTLMTMISLVYQEHHFMLPMMMLLIVKMHMGRATFVASISSNCAAFFLTRLKGCSENMPENLQLNIYISSSDCVLNNLILF